MTGRLLGAHLVTVALLLAMPTGTRPETLSELVSYALQHHPELQAIGSAVRAAQEATQPARTWPDPRISVGIMNVSGTEWTVGKMDMAQASISLSQEIPIRGKLGIMGAVAQADVTKAQASLAKAKNRIAAEVALAALDLYELDRTVAIDREIRDRFDAAVRAAEGRLAVGQAMQQDVVSMMLEVEMSDAAIREALDRRPALVARLNGLLNRPIGTTFDSLAAAPLSGAPADTLTLVANALADQPELARLRASVQQAEAMRTLATRERVPDPMVMARYGNRGGMEGIYEIGFSMAIPVHAGRRQEAAVRQSSAMLDMRRREVDAMELETRSMVSSMAARLVANERLLRSYDETLLPRARQVVEASLASYVVGQTSLIWVLDAARRLYRLEKERLMYEVMQRRMFVELEQRLGRAATIGTGEATYVR